MARTTPRLAKLTRPRLHAAIARDRLFAQLDESRTRRAAVFVAGPPGAGKSTLVATWADARKIRGIWYQLDAGDADLPTFFHYLAEAALPFRRRGHPALPSLTPEYLFDVPGFARRFFRALFARLPADAVVVLDNCQDVGSEHPFNGLIADALDEVLDGQMLILVSRKAPDPDYARALANERLTVIGWSELRLSLDEAWDIARQRGVGQDPDVNVLHAQSAGWAAGYTLLLERLQNRTSVRDPQAADDFREVFDYFAGQLFDRFSEAARHLLITLSFLPRMNRSGAVALTGTADAVKLLQDLHRRQLFTDRRTVGDTTYQFHGLFRAFLQDRAEQALQRTEIESLARRAAVVMESSGHAEEAVALYLRAGDIGRCRAAILQSAPRLIAEGRWRVVVDWISSLPQNLVDRDCWLLHWLGTARGSVAPGEARRALVASFTLATEAKDDACRLQAVAGVIETHILEYAAFRPLDHWIDVLEDCLPEPPRFEDDASELRVQAAMLIALAYRRPASSYLPSCVQRVMGLVQGDAPANLRLAAAAYVVAYGTTTGPLEVAHRALPVLEALLNHPRASALNAAFASFIIAHYHIIGGNERESRRASDRVEAISRDNGLPFVASLAFVMRAWLECELGNLQAARAVVARLTEFVTQARPYDVASLHSLQMLVAYLGGHSEQASMEGRKAIELFDSVGSVMHRMLNRDITASVALEMGLPEEAKRLLAELRGIVGGVRPAWLEGRIRLHEALALIDTGHHEEGLRALREGLKFARDHGTEAQLRFAKPVMPRILAHALRAGIEVPYVRELIRSQGLSAPSADVEAWPWPVRVYTLGRFSVLLGDEPLRFTHKVPRKPFLLLKAIIALGGRDVREEALLDALWPQESGDAAHEAFGQTLMRLRRLLQCQGAVQLVGGRVSLDETLLWTDARALERITNSPDEGGEVSGGMLELYRGDFLADEADQPWSASLRERLRERFLRSVTTSGTKLEQAGRWEDALQLYLRGLDADSLAESFYQGVMRCHAARGMPSEGLSAYRRLRQQLSIVLGVQPSASTQALARELASS